MYSDLKPIVVMGVVCALLIAVAYLLVKNNSDDTDSKIKDCVERGGTPLVIGHAYTSEFKACIFE